MMPILHFNIHTESLCENSKKFESPHDILHTNCALIYRLHSLNRIYTDHLFEFFFHRQYNVY